MQTKLLNSDTIPGLLVAAFGAAALFVGRTYPVGTPTAMGPGSMPMLLGWSCVVLGGILILRGLLGRAEPLEGEWPLRATLFILAGILVFAGLIERAGLAITVAAMVVTVSFARPGGRLVLLLALCLGLALATVLIFVVALGLPLSIGPR